MAFVVFKKPLHTDGCFHLYYYNGLEHRQAKGAPNYHRHSLAIQFSHRLLRKGQQRPQCNFPPLYRRVVVRRHFLSFELLSDLPTPISTVVLESSSSFCRTVAAAARRELNLRSCALPCETKRLQKARAASEKVAVAADPSATVGSLMTMRYYSCCQRCKEMHDIAPPASL